MKVLDLMQNDLPAWASQGIRVPYRGRGLRSGPHSQVKEL